MSEGNALTTTTEQVGHTSEREQALAIRKAEFDHNWRVAKAHAASSLVPQHLRDKPGDCFILIELANRWDKSPFMVMQSVSVIHGRPCIESKLMIGLLNDSGKIRGTIKYELGGNGDDYGCRAWAVDSDTGERVYGPRVTRRMVKAEGWDKDKGTQKSKWATMPDLMYMYRAAAFFIRTNYPEVVLGINTREETEDVIDVHSRPVPVLAASSLNAALGLGGEVAEDDTQDAEVAGEAEEPATDPTEPADDRKPNPDGSFDW